MTLENTYKYLQDFGFDAEQVKAAVERKSKTREQYLQEIQYLPFDDTDIRYELNFLRYHIDGDFYLESIKSVYTLPLDIPSLQVGSVDTDILDRRMGNMNWTGYFNARGLMAKGELEEISAVLSDLQMLSESKDGYHIADSLKVKHWPDSMLSPHQLELKEQHQRTELFRPDEDELWSPALAYYRLTGQVEDLLDKMEPLRIPRLEYSELKEAIQTILLTKQDAFDFHHSYFDGDSFVKIQIPVQSIDSSFQLGEFQVSVKQLPEIAYGVFNGVNTFLLSAKMTHTDWDEGVEWLSQDMESFRPPVDEILEMLEKLAEDQNGAAIASNLRLRYFTDIDFFETTCTDKKDWDYLEGLQPTEDKFPAELNVKRAANLLKGNAVYLDEEMFAGKEITGWLSMDTAAVTENGSHPITCLQDYTEAQLSAQLDMLPISNHRYYSVPDRLLSGYMVNVALKDGMEIFIKADPLNSTLRIYDEYKQEIPFNFNLDVNWRPSVRQQENIARITPVTPKESKHPPVLHPKKPLKKRGRSI